MAVTKGCKAQTHKILIITYIENVEAISDFIYKLISQTSMSGISCNIFLKLEEQTFAEANID